MVPLPRLALGAIQSEAETDLVCWALLDVLKRSGCQPQHFFSRCAFCPINGAITATGLASRHLDSWLMTADLCRELLVRGSGNSDLVVIEGRYDACYSGPAPGGSLDELCRRLDLPRLVVIDVRRLEGCQVPGRPAADGLILDGVRDSADHYHWQTALESLWRIPVMAALAEQPQLRAAVRALPGGSNLPDDLCAHLGAAMAPTVRLEQLRRLAASRPLPDARETAIECAVQRRITVAVAYDQAFHCYFQDTFDLLEAAGASVVDFSPLHEESLPAGTDVVYLGCGHPERHARALAENHCMMSAMRNHLCAGKRIYADGGGLAYLCQSLETPQTGAVPMLGALPAVARLNPSQAPCRPIELTFARDNWLAPPGTALRGYLSTRWQLEPVGQLAGMLQEPGHERDVVGGYHAIASRLQVNFATQPGFVRTFFQPHVPKVALGGVQVATS